MDSPTTAWIGPKDLVRTFLKQVGADLENPTAFKLSEPHILGLGGKEVVIPLSVRYFIDGATHPLAEHLAAVGGINVRCF